MFSLVFIVINMYWLRLLLPMLAAVCLLSLFTIKKAKVLGTHNQFVFFFGFFCVLFFEGRYIDRVGFYPVREVVTEIVQDVQHVG